MALGTSDRTTSAGLGYRFANVRLLHAGKHYTWYEGCELRTDRLVTIKVPADTTLPWVLQGLDREAKILATLGAHPHIVTVYERAVLDDARPALLLQRCQGSIVTEQRHGRARSLQTITSVGIKLAGALETVHCDGVLHRDVRPNNVLLTEEGEPVLAGFDQAVYMDDIDSRTPEGLHVTTPYTAPELLEGHQATRATDVYGLASTMYELLAGRSAVRAYTGETAGLGSLRVSREPEAPTALPHVPQELCEVLAWAMSLDPTARPPSPAWLAEGLGWIEHHQGWARTRMTVG